MEAFLKTLKFMCNFFGINEPRKYLKSIIFWKSWEGFILECTYPGKFLFITGSFIFRIGNFELYSSESSENQMVGKSFKANMSRDCTL